MTPDQYTNKEFFIEVGNGHQLYVYDWGNPKGLPIIFLHGGPGSEVKDGHKQAFDPTKYHVIFFDQRGCGKSLPLGSLDHNTTPDLVNDISKITDHLKWRQFVLYAHSWGACLALAYAIKNPKRVKAMVLGSVFTGSKKEIEWIEQGQFRTFFPEVWDRFLSHTPKAHHKNPTAYHYKNILGKSEQLMHSSALAVEEMEHSIMGLDDRTQPLDATAFDPTGAQMFAHYLSNNLFMPDRYILDNAHKLAMPIWMVHGRFDMECPPITVYELNQKLPNSRLTWAISNHRSEHENTTLIRTMLLHIAETL
jgi:proline iminopeptidase